MDTQVRKEITEALQTLSNASKDERDQIKRIVQDKFYQLRDILGDQGYRLQERLAQGLAQGREQVTERFSEIDSRVRNNPWPYLATAAASSFILGVLFSNNKKNNC